MFERQRQQVLEGLDVAHAAFYASEVFGGPSLYFHIQALAAGRAGDVDVFADKVYALLSSWGMHRMGPGGSKMCEFDNFRASLKQVWPTILTLQRAQPGSLDAREMIALRDVFCGIRCMASAASLVGNSKVMAHALPNLVPPVDREYTLRFLFGRTDISNDIDKEWSMLDGILRGFFYPILQAESFLAKTAIWALTSKQFGWDTSPLKWPTIL